MSKKIVILGFDGLEYDFVERFKLLSLKQKYYGKVQIPPECYEKTRSHALISDIVYEPWTPYVWSTFLTGELPKKTGISRATLYKWDNKPLQLLRALSLKFGFAKIKNKRKLFEMMGFKRRSFTEKDYPCKTIFDYSKNPVIINVPTVSPEWSLELEDADKSFEKTIEKQWASYFEVKRRTLVAVRSPDFDLLMSYTRLLDTIGELCYSSFRSMFKAYLECNHYVTEIKNFLPKNTFFLIVSDHGMEKLGNTKFGKHSNYGFYSCNFPIKVQRTTDFYPVIAERLKNLF